MWQKRIFASAAILVLALVVAFPAAGLLAGESSTDTTDLSTTESNVLEAYGKLPLLFIQNQGQVDEAVKYYVTSSGQMVYFTEENIVFDLIHYDQAKADDTADRQAERLVFSLNFLGANSQPAIEGSGKDGAAVNYFIGNDPEKWHANVPTYRELVYRDIYPNVDLRLYGNGGMLRYDFVVNPGATPEEIALAYNGIDSLAIIDGELVIGTAFGNMVQSQPYIYQQIGDEVVEVEGGFRLDSDNTYGFHVAAYNNHYPLIIDPVLLDYSTYLGGTSNDLGNGIAVDTDNYAYVTGQMLSLDFPTTPGAFQVANAGSSDAFVTKLSQDGASLVYSTYLGGTDYDDGLGIALDSDNHAYVTGVTNSLDFPTTQGAFQVAFAGYRDAFVTKLSQDGSALVYSTYLGGENEDEGNSIAVDLGGCAYVTGYTESASFPTTQGAFQVANAGYYDAFVTKLSQDGSALVYSTYLGGEGNDVGEGIALDSDNHAYVTGCTQSLGFPTTPGAFQVVNAGSLDAFVTKLSQDGSALMYSTYLGGTGSNDGHAIAVDTGGCAYVTGETYYSDFPTTPGVFQVANAGGSDAFVTKLSQAGNALVYSTYLGGENHDVGEGIAVDSNNCAYVTGWTYSLSFPTTQGAFQVAYTGSLDAFVTKLVATYNLTITSTAGGTVTTPGVGTFTRDEGTVVNLVATPNAGYRFVNWTGNVTTIANVNAATTNITMNDDYSITANFVAVYDLTITITAGGTVTTPGVGTFTYEKGTVVNLVATPASGYRFVNWTGNVATISCQCHSTTITMNGDYSITANFEMVSSPGWCFIATAAYGTPMAEEVQILREFRDEYLLTNPVGQALVGLYYRVSPPMAEFITEHPSLKPIVRAGLVPAVAMSIVIVNTSPAEKAAIVGLLALVSVALAVWAMRRRGRGPQYT